MPDQGHIFIGIPINDPRDLIRAASHFNVTPPGNTSDMEWWNQVFNASIRIEGKNYSIGVFDSRDEYRWSTKTNTKTGQVGDSYVLLGVELTARYSPAIIDAGWGAGGRPEPFILDLDRLAKIRAEVVEQWPEAEILLLDLNH